MNTTRNTILVLVGLALLLPETAQSIGVERLAVTQHCGDCAGEYFALYDDEVYLIVEQDDLGSGPSIDAIKLVDESVTNLVAGVVGSVWWVVHAAGKYVVVAQDVSDESFYMVDTSRIDLSNPSSPVLLPDVDGYYFNASRVDASGRVVGHFVHPHPAATELGGAKYEDGTGSTIIGGWGTRSVGILDSPDIILTLDWQPPVPWVWYLIAREGGTSTLLNPDTSSGPAFIGPNFLDPVTILAVIDGVAGYITGVGGGFAPLESGGTPVAVTENFLFWNGASGCTGYSSTLGTFDIGSRAGGGALLDATCGDAIEHDGKLYVALDGSAIVVTFGVVEGVPSLSPAGWVALAALLAGGAAITRSRRPRSANA